jgi:phosphatidylinositol alpha-1,6-mannosyltransferase
MSRGANRHDRQPRILFCTVTQEPGHGGIARVSSLVWTVIEDQFPGLCERLIAAPSGKDYPSVFEKSRFAAKAIGHQVFRECDIVLFDHLGLARVQTLLPVSLRRPYGVFLHSLEAWAPLDRTRLNAISGAKLRVANSHYTASRIAEAHPDAGEIAVCHLTLGRNMLHAASPGVLESTAIADQVRPNSVLIVGRMMTAERYKGHDQLIRAWSLVLESVTDAQLVVVGRGDDMARLRQLVGARGVADNVLFTGHVSEATLAEIYRRAAVFAMPSRAEGFGIVYLEAMRHGLPCIGSIHDAAGEIIVDGETGYLVDQDDLNALAGKISQLLVDPELRHGMGRRGLERLQCSFSPERFDSVMSELLVKLAS